MLSVLALRYGRPGAQQVEELNSCDWVVWEPGAWHAPRTHDTLVAEGVRHAQPTEGEALAIPLERAGKELLVGRDPKAQIPINDATLSAIHLALVPGDVGWAVRDLGSRNGTKVNGLKLAPQLPFPLRNGAQIDAGGVRLTFYTTEGMRSRLEAAADRLHKP